MAGVFPYFSGVPAKNIEPAPDLGQHNGEIYGDMLHLSAEEREALARRGVI
jgi:crotonobetainyl-CoA:carnitine CoA-transferase CaiB-like acyl-CoA transferase